MEFAPNPLPERFLVEIVEGDRAGEVAEAVALYERGNVESFRLGGRSPFAPRA
jgi:hypothetical protein